MNYIYVWFICFNRLKLKFVENRTLANWSVRALRFSEENNWAYMVIFNLLMLMSMIRNKFARNKFMCTSQEAHLTSRNVYNFLNVQKYEKIFQLDILYLFTVLFDSWVESTSKLHILLDY